MKVGKASTYMDMNRQAPYGDGDISNTSIVYTKAPIQGSIDTLQNDQSLRLQFKSSDIQLCDIANSTLNFTLMIKQGNTDSTSLNMLVPNESVMDLFEVQQVSWGGIRMNLQQLNYAGMLYRRVRSKCRGEQYRLTTGQTNAPEDVDVSGTGDYSVSVVIDGENATVNYGVGDAGTGIFPNSDFRALQKFWGSTVAASNSLNPAALISEQERFRLLSEAARHYKRTVTGATPLKPTYAKTEGVDNLILKQYSIKLGELIPELMDFKIVDKSLFVGSGLEIQLNLLNPFICMQKLPLPPTSTDANFAVGLSGRTASDSYTLSNLYMGMVYHKSVSPLLGMLKMKTFTSIYHTKQAITASSVNHQFSLNAGCLVKGVIVLYSPLQTVVDIPKFSSNAAYTLGASLPSHKKLSKAYFQNERILETSLQIGNNVYPQTQAPPVGSKSNWYYQIAQAYSEQVMGVAYSTSFERFLTIDFAQFIPVQRVVDQGELFQFYQSYETSTEYAEKELNILVVCTRTIEFPDDGSVRIENVPKPM